MIKEPLYMDQHGVDKLDEEIHRLKKEILIIDVFNREDTTDRYNTGAEETIRRKEILSTQLTMLLEQRARVIITKKQENSEIIDFDDIVAVNYLGTNNIVTFKLVGGDGNINKDIKEISVNSPLGSAVYKKHVGDICTFNVKDKEYTISIEEKLDLTSSADVEMKQSR